jgi:hypothetical protein
VESRVCLKGFRKSQSSFSTLSVGKRDEVLLEIIKTLHFTALISSAVKDWRGKAIAKLAARIDAEPEAL